MGSKESVKLTGLAENNIHLAYMEDDEVLPVDWELITGIEEEAVTDLKNLTE